MDKDTDASEWLLDQGATADVSERTPGDAASERTPLREGSERELDSEGVQADADARDLTMVVEALTVKVEALERAVAAQSERIETELRLARERSAVGRDTTGSEAPLAPWSSAPPANEAAERDINRVTFEDLRILGLSVTQAARLISERQARGGFKSLDELDELRGFPRQQLGELKRAITI
jgi:DNA uptake protein ComE-like DNA-binding protein